MHYDLNSDESKDLIDEMMTDAATRLRAKLSDHGFSVIFLKNRRITNTAIELASKTVDYHGIRAPKVTSNAKIFAHACFWLVKLYPWSFIETKDVLGLAKTAFNNYADVIFSEPAKGILGVGESEPHVELVEFDDRTVFRINEFCALYMFASLIAYDKYEDPNLASEKIEKFLISKKFVEVCKSLKFHNYSARSMAMYLEALAEEGAL